MHIRNRKIENIPSRNKQGEHHGVMVFKNYSREKIDGVVLIHKLNSLSKSENKKAFLCTQNLNLCLN